MIRNSFLPFLCLSLMLVAAHRLSYAQEEGQSRTLVCRREAFAALRPLPKLEYACRAASANDYDETILKRPERKRAITELLRRLGRLTSREWWESSVEDLNICYFRGKPGALSAEESSSFASGEYQFRLFGNDRIRLVITPDPCFQTSYGGSNVFLLYRERGRVSVTEVLDGYYSRADNSILLDFATQNSEQIIEVATTTGGLNPYTTNYYFAIDKRFRRAVPKKLFREGKTATNKITSAMNMNADGDSASNSAEMEIIKAGRLAKTFYKYEDDTEGQTNDNGRPLTKRVYRWNGSYYVKVK